jgi:hypothetical protein
MEKGYQLGVEPDQVARALPAVRACSTTFATASAGDYPYIDTLRLIFAYSGEQTENRRDRSHRSFAV